MACEFQLARFIPVQIYALPKQIVKTLALATNLMLTRLLTVGSKSPDFRPFTRFGVWKVLDELAKDAHFCVNELSIQDLVVT